MVYLFTVKGDRSCWYGLFTINKESLKNVPAEERHNYQDRFIKVHPFGPIEDLTPEDAKTIVNNIDKELKPEDLQNFKRVAAEIFLRSQYDYIKERPMEYDEWLKLKERGEIDMEETREKKITEQTIQDMQFICYKLSDAFNAYGIPDVKFKMSGIETGSFVEWGSRIPKVCLCGSGKYTHLSKDGKKKTIALAMSVGGYQRLFQEKTPTEVDKLSLLQKSIFCSTMFGKMDEIITKLTCYDLDAVNVRNADSVEGLMIEDVKATGVIVTVEIEFGKDIPIEKFWMFFPGSILEEGEKEEC